MFADQCEQKKTAFRRFVCQHALSFGYGGSRINTDALITLPRFWRDEACPTPGSSQGHASKVLELLRKDKDILSVLFFLSSWHRQSQEKKAGDPLEQAGNCLLDRFQAGFNPD
jgi:hypothetical protein